MRLISIDIETTGLDPSYCSVLEVGAVIFDPQPVPGENCFRARPFECLLKHDRVQGEPYALQMNQEIMQELAGVKKTHVSILNATEFTTRFRDFIVKHSGGVKLHPCGKNYGSFDQQFLQRIPGWNQNVKPLLNFRSLDVGSLYFNPRDEKILGLPQCLERIGCSGTVTHRALDDALAVMTAVTRFYS